MTENGSDLVHGAPRRQTAHHHTCGREEGTALRQNPKMTPDRIIDIMPFY
jgi:hypothetical protein